MFLLALEGLGLHPQITVVHAHVFFSGTTFSLHVFKQSDLCGVKPCFFGTLYFFALLETNFS